MKYLLILALFLVGCGTDSDTFEPYQVGTWMVTSETSAEWIGADVSFKGDTLIVNHPDSISLTIIEDTLYADRVILTFTDSTQQAIGRPSYNDVIFPGNSGFTGGNDISMNSDSTQITISTHIAYNDGVQYQDPEYIHVVFDTIRTYSLLVLGFKDTMVDILN